MGSIFDMGENLEPDREAIGAPLTYENILAMFEQLRDQPTPSRKPAIHPEWEGTLEEFRRLAFHDAEDFKRVFRAETGEDLVDLDAPPMTIFGIPVEFDDSLEPGTWEIRNPIRHYRHRLPRPWSS